MFGISTARRAGIRYLKGYSRNQRTYSSGRNVTGKWPSGIEVSELENKLRVVTVGSSGYFSGVGAYIDAGIRYEKSNLLGVSHLMDRILMKSSTSTYADPSEIQTEIDMIGGPALVAALREGIVLESAVFKDDVPKMLGLISDSLLNANYLPEEIELVKESVVFEHREFYKQAHRALLELSFQVGYGNSGLGNPHVCPPEVAESITRDDLLAYRDEFFRPEKIIVGINGIPHDKAVDLAQKNFGHLLPGEKTKYEPAHYVGGMLEEPKGEVMGEYDSKFSHMFIGFEGFSHSADESYAQALLHILLGGGGSFSSGGPGKGMFSRLFQNVLNQYYWVEHCQAFNETFMDTSMIGILASVNHRAAHRIGDVICQEFARLMSSGPYGLDKEELERAKKQLKSWILIQTESPLTDLEDSCRQLQASDKIVSKDEMCKRIDALTITQVRSVAEKIFRGQVNNVGKGTGMPTIITRGAVYAMGDVFAQCKKFGLGRL